MKGGEIIKHLRSKLPKINWGIFTANIEVVVALVVLWIVLWYCAEFMVAVVSEYVMSLVR